MGKSLLFFFLFVIAIVMFKIADEETTFDVNEIMAEELISEYEEGEIVKN